MAREGYTETKKGIVEKRLDVAEAQERLTAAEAMSEDTDGARHIKNVHVTAAREAYDRHKAELDRLEATWQTFAKVEPRQKRGPRRYFASTRSVMLSATQEMHDAIDAHCEAERISIPELIRRALASYLKLECKPCNTQGSAF